MAPPGETRTERDIATRHTNTLTIQHAAKQHTTTRHDTKQPHEHETEKHNEEPYNATQQRKILHHATNRHATTRNTACHDITRRNQTPHNHTKSNATRRNTTPQHCATLHNATPSTTCDGRANPTAKSAPRTGKRGCKQTRSAMPSGVSGPRPRHEPSMRRPRAARWRHTGFHWPTCPSNQRQRAPSGSRCRSPQREGPRN